MRRRGAKRLKRWLRRATAPFRKEVVILLYHRVHEPPSDPLLLAVTPTHFAEHLDVLRRHYQVLSLRQLVTAVRDRNLPKRAVVLTFDDGYVDNLWNAKPLLERYDVPATVFVTTEGIGKRQTFWWDEIERILLWTPRLPETLTVALDGTTYEWHLGGWAQLPDGARRTVQGWHILTSTTPTLRHRAYRELHRLLRPLPYAQQEAVLDQLRAQAGIERMEEAEARVMTPEEIGQLAEGGLVEVGAHTETHPVLARQPLDVQRMEIARSKQHLEEILGRPVTAFSYPYGGRGDIGENAAALVREAGYEVACANFPAPVTSRSDLFLLPRCLVRDWDGEEFARRLHEWFRM